MASKKVEVDTSANPHLPGKKAEVTKIKGGFETILFANETEIGRLTFRPDKGIKVSLEEYAATLKKK